MIVNVEFFDAVPIENVRTCLNYKVDKTIFFGQKEIMEKRKEITEQFLKTICGVSEVEFCDVDSVDLALIIDVISNKIEQEIAEGNQVFCDLTGGDSLPLLALGIVGKELNASMHMFDKSTGELYGYSFGSAPLSEVAEYRPISLNLDQYIYLYGGNINYRMQKGYKHSWGEEENKDIANLWTITRKYRHKWPYYCELMRKFEPDSGLSVEKESAAFVKEFQSKQSLGKIKSFKNFLDDCEAYGLLQSVSHENGVFKYTYKNDMLKSCFGDVGSILELYVFLKESQEGENDDCRVGVHIDWDGEIHVNSREDVLNEIDILSIKNNVPTFISCKIGNVDQMALYELDTVASRFGGRYAKKVLAVAKEVMPTHLLRAKDMGIEIRKIK